MATTDAAMELLEQIQHDFGEGPYLQAYSQDRAVAVADLRAAPAWTRIEAVVGQLHVCGVLSVPIRLADQPVGTLDLYSTQPRAWTTHELEAAGEFATVAGELVHTSVELATRELELTQLRQALTSRIWIEQAKGSSPPPRALGPEEAFGQLRRRAAQADLAQRRSALDQARVAADERDRLADQRNHAADEREHLADARERAADERERMADDRDRIANGRDRVADERDRTAYHSD